VSCRLDYCNSLLAGVADVHLRRLQSVQNAAARLVSDARRHDHITLILATLHWLPVRQQVIYKTAVLVWQCLQDAASRYLADLCVPAASTDGRRQSRCAVSGSPGLPDRTIIIIIKGIYIAQVRKGHKCAMSAEMAVKSKKKGKVFPYSLPSVGPGADPGVQAVSPQVT